MLFERVRWAVLIGAMTAVALACGSEQSAREGDDGGAEDAGPMLVGKLGGPLTFTGDFTMGTVVAARHTCPMPLGGGSGDNISPPLEWEGGPPDTKSFALVLYDTVYKVTHWTVWDISPAVSALPEGIPSGYAIDDPSGAHQLSFGADKEAYFGPCSTGEVAGSYEYRLYALDTATLPELSKSSTPRDAQAAIESAAIEMTVWTGAPE